MKKPATMKSATKKKPAQMKKPAPRADYGAPIDSFFAKQSPAMRPILEALRELIEEVVPDAQSSIKWGNPFYTLDGQMMAAMSGHKAHVNLILAGPPKAFADPRGRLSGAGVTGRHLKLTSIDQLPRDEVKGWLRTAEKLARAKLS
jgi:hypothetical protein